MSTKFSSLLLFALLLAHREMIMLGKAAVCDTQSGVFRGLCISSSNCAAICEKEGYQFGTCKKLKCICATNCSGGGGGQLPPGGDDGGQNPPGGDDGGQNPPGGDDGGQNPPGGDGSEQGPPGGDGGDGGQAPPSN